MYKERNRHERKNQEKEKGEMKVKRKKRYLQWSEKKSEKWMKKKKENKFSGEMWRVVVAEEFVASHFVGS